MKSKVSKNPARAGSLTINHPKSTIHHPLYSVRRHKSFWSLTFNGQEACFDHEQGAYYVAYLLLNPPSEPIHGMALELKASAYFKLSPGSPCETYITDPLTGNTMILGCDVALVERNLCVDEADGLAYIRRKQEELEAILEDETASEPVKAEVQRELEELYAYQKKNPSRIPDEAQKAVRAVREAIHHFHESLAKSVDPRGNPHPVLRKFAAYLEKHLLIPSGRYSQAGRGRIKTGVAGCFTYEAPSGVRWTA